MQLTRLISRPDDVLRVLPILPSMGFSPPSFEAGCCLFFPINLVSCCYYTFPSSPFFFTFPCEDSSCSVLFFSRNSAARFLFEANFCSCIRFLLSAISLNCSEYYFPSLSCSSGLTAWLLFGWRLSEFLEFAFEASDRYCML